MWLHFNHYVPSKFCVLFVWESSRFFKAAYWIDRWTNLSTYVNEFQGYRIWYVSVQEYQFGNFVVHFFVFVRCIVSVRIFEIFAISSVGSLFVVIGRILWNCCYLLLPFIPYTWLQERAPDSWIQYKSWKNRPLGPLRLIYTLILISVDLKVIKLGWCTLRHNTIMNHTRAWQGTLII